MDTRLKIPYDDALTIALRHSHEQVLKGNTYTMDYVEHFMDKKVYEYTARFNDHII